MISEVAKLRELTEQVSKHDSELGVFYRQWHHVFDALPNLMFVVDKNYRIKFVNHALESRLKIRKTDLLNKKISVTGDTYYINDGSGKYKKTGATFVDELSKGYFEYNASPIYDDEKNLLGYVCVVEDIVKDNN